VTQVIPRFEAALGVTPHISNDGSRKVSILYMHRKDEKEKLYNQCDYSPKNECDSNGAGRLKPYRVNNENNGLSQRKYSIFDELNPPNIKSQRNTRLRTNNKEIESTKGVIVKTEIRTRLQQPKTPLQSSSLFLFQNKTENPMSNQQTDTATPNNQAQLGNNQEANSHPQTVNIKRMLT
jgi:hypothetical protein